MRLLPTEHHSNSHINLHEMHFSSEAQLKPQLLSYSNKFYTRASASASGLPTILSEHDLVLKCTERLNNKWWRGTPRQPRPPQLPLNAKQCTAEARIFCLSLITKHHFLKFKFMPLSQFLLPKATGLNRYSVKPIV